MRLSSKFRLIIAPAWPFTIYPSGKVVVVFPQLGYAAIVDSIGRAQQ